LNATIASYIREHVQTNALTPISRLKLMELGMEYVLAALQTALDVLVNKYVSLALEVY